MHDWTDRFVTAGGGLGGITAYFMQITPKHMLEIGLYALVGSLIGEGIKELILFVKRKKSNTTNGK